MNRLKSTTSKIPLNYVIRDNEVPVPNAVYATESETLVKNALLQGVQFDRDNERVYGILKQLILEGPAWPFIIQDVDRASHGRNAWLALRAHYEGESFLTKQKEKAYAALDTIHYMGEHATFTFEHFTNVLTKAYHDLQHFGEPVVEVKKVWDLLAKITDLKLEAPKQTTKITPGYKDNFLAAITFLAQCVSPLPKGGSRQICELVTAGRSTRGRSGRYGRNQQNTPYGRGGARGRGNNLRGGRDGRQGRYNPRGGRGGRGARYIAPQDWANMTHEQQQQVFAKRRTLQNVQQVQIDEQDAMSAVTGLTAPGIQNTPTIPPVIHGVVSVNQMSSNSNQGSTFGGRAAYRNA